MSTGSHSNVGRDRFRFAKNAHRISQRRNARKISQIVVVENPNIFSFKTCEYAGGFLIDSLVPERPYLIAHLLSCNANGVASKLLTIGS